jgi:hypothetical protein
MVGGASSGLDSALSLALKIPICIASTTIYVPRALAHLITP